MTTPGVTYYYNVTALNTDGEGPSSNQDFGMPITAPSVPLSLTATPSNNGVNLTWDQPTFVGGSPITGYEIFRGTSPGDETSLTTIGTDLSHYNDSIAVPGTYYYYVEAINDINNSAPSNEVSATPLTYPESRQTLL